MQELVRSSTRREGGFQSTCCSFTSRPPEGIFHCTAALNPQRRCGWWDVVVVVVFKNIESKDVQEVPL